MPDIRPVSLSQYADKRWKRYTGYQFAAQDSAVQLDMEEVPKAMLLLPLAFIPQGDGFKVAALLGLGAGKNLFVALDGRWVGGYVPAQYRSYPFVFSPVENGGYVLCVNEDSGLVTQDPADELFFTEDGQQAPVIQDLLKFLQLQARGHLALDKACAALQAQGLLEPWPIKVQGEQGVQEVQGLYRVNEQALNALDAESLYALKQAGALNVAYCQLLSMQHLSNLGTLLQAHNQIAATQAEQAASKELDLGFLNQRETFSFGGV